ncbi:MAG: DUF115 domain-containing protein [Treponema sp.]|jgi:hypothetical protein|nr:DUF115 domain-containing protein [Treponema sp.]
MAALHSRYNPQAEAERYLAALSIPPEIRCFILIEPGLGYMIPILSRRFPGARIMVLRVSAPRDGAPVQDGDAVYWDPGTGTTAEDFLGQELDNLAEGENSAGKDFGPEAVKIIEWRPSLNLYGDSYVRLLAAAAAALRRFDAERRTLRAFGRRWFRNFFRNLRIFRRFPVYSLREEPVLITGAGPSLEGSLPLIAELRQNCFIIAASSSAQALLRRNILPDLVLSTDGGGWALLHLYELFRRNGSAWPEGQGRELAASCTANLPSQCGNLPVLAIADGSLWQGLVLRGLGIPHLVLPQRGTVTAAAIDLALALGRGKVIIAGVDLDIPDIRTHVRPYAFDRLEWEGASRIQPEYGRRFFRSTALREGGSHRIYAEWFAARLASYPGRLYTLGDNNRLFEGLPRITVRDAAPAGKAASGGFHEQRPLKDAPGLALGILEAALEDERTRETLAGELAPLIFPGGPRPRRAELRAGIESIIRPYLLSSGSVRSYG